MGLESQAIMVYSSEKKLFNNRFCALWEQFYEKEFWARLEILLDTYIHHFQFNGIT